MSVCPLKFEFAAWLPRLGALNAALLVSLSLGCSSKDDSAGAGPPGALGGDMDPSPMGADPVTGEPGPGDLDGALPNSGALCTPGAAPDAALLRLHRGTYANALRDIFGGAAVDAILPSLESLPAARTGVYSTQLSAPSFSEVSAYADIASALAYSVAGDETRLGQLAPCLTELSGVVDAAADPCLGDLVDRLAVQVLRGPINAEKRAELLDAYKIGGVDSVADGVATLLTTLLLDPQFLYFVEVDGVEVSPGIVALTPHEVAARIARVLWDSTPDPQLQQAADGGLDAESLAQQVQRMWQDPRATHALERFFDEWLELERIPYAPKEFAEDSAQQTALRQAMTDEVLGLVDQVILKQGGSYADLLLTREANIQEPLLAGIYGLDPADVGQVLLPETHRAGLLTRAGWLSTMPIPGSDAGHVIKRGVKLSHFVCRPLPPPDPNAFPADDPADPSTGAALAIRERFLKATAEPQCMGCHRSLDGFGAPFGNFGSAGQWIDAETATDSEGAGSTLPINAQSQIEIDGTTLMVDDAVALSEALAVSELGPSCFARQYTQNIFGRTLNKKDGCLVQAAVDVMRGSDETPGSLRDALTTLLTSETFKLRSVEGGTP